MYIFLLGRLIWAISNFTERMRMSKESNMILNSPVFYSSEFGYKLQVSPIKNNKILNSNCQ